MREMKQLLTFFLSLALVSCSPSYPGDRIKESIQEICSKEYGIEQIDVKIDGNTVGVYLPMKKLFNADFKEALMSGKGKIDVENLFQPAPEALDQVEDVLFSISRVLLSTDLKLDFYILQATDIEVTGLQLVLTGFVDDIRRVRLWDISRDEYRKRVLHELKLNRSVLWHKPVRALFDTLEKEPSLESIQKHYDIPLTPELLQSFFFMSPEINGNKYAKWGLGELRSTPLETNRVLVYTPVTIDYDPNEVPEGAYRLPPGTSLEYFFIVALSSHESKIIRTIPLSYVDEYGNLNKVPIPPEFNLEKDLESWETEFQISAIPLGDFLAEQLNRRMQTLLFSDERIQNTFETIQLNIRFYKEEPENYFSLDLNLKQRGTAPVPLVPSVLNEDILYLLDLVSREFVDVLRSYRFSDYAFLQLKLPSHPFSHNLGKEELELFRREKVDLQGLLLPR
ncbi:MAG: hypothetical protein HY447_00945 [Candidatus Omnitrophica bacterium]|nr:hypothetical protein [Candidatus Omnitrophota bacterium]